MAHGNSNSIVARENHCKPEMEGTYSRDPEPDDVAYATPGKDHLSPVHAHYSRSSTI